MNNERRQLTDAEARAYSILLRCGIPRRTPADMRNNPATDQEYQDVKKLLQLHHWESWEYAEALKFVCEWIGY